MNRESWLGRLRWWHAVTCILVVVSPLSITGLMWLEDWLWQSSIATPSGASSQELRWLDAIGVGVFAAAGIPLLWVFLALPWLDSSDQRFTERMPPRRKMWALLLIAWTPALVTSGIVLVLLGDAIFWWWRNSRWDPEGLSSIWTWLILALALMWGWQFGRVLRRRLIRSQQRARVCFNCAYSLAEIPNCQRCPECGTEIPVAGGV